MISLEMFNTISVFISSIIIASAGIFVTYKYNSNQLRISMNKDLSDLIPKLGSPEPNLRKFSAISLALYGKYAAHASIATLDDDDENVRTAAITSLSIIGDPVIPELVRTYQNKRNSNNKRSGALYALGLMGASISYELAIPALEDPNICYDAASVLGFLKDKRSVGKLLSALKKSKERDDVTLTSNIVWALGEIQDVPITDDLISLLDHPDENVRLQTAWALGNIGNKTTLDALSKVKSNDTSEKVREEAKKAYDLIKSK